MHDHEIGDYETELGGVDDRVAAAMDTVPDEVLPRFPVVRHGYDCARVDEYVAELEQELAELDCELAAFRASTPACDETAAEIERIGKETSAILLAAHDSAEETTRRAQAQADSCVAEARSNALAVTEAANRQVSELREEIASLCRERERILEDVRHSAGALSALAEDATDTTLHESMPPAPVPAEAVKRAPAPDSELTQHAHPGPGRPVQGTHGRH
ncbi:MAG: DivIVA domain-containing protein [Actinobacteria bacterium]|nr:DivIVA domain-containing protein [Actinomycetota bacterium]